MIWANLVCHVVLYFFYLYLLEWDLDIFLMAHWIHGTWVCSIESLENDETFKVSALILETPTDPSPVHDSFLAPEFQSGSQAMMM